MRTLFTVILVLCLFPTALAQSATGRELTILYTNDFHSAIDPIPAYWLPGSPKLGGAAELAGLVNQIRKQDQTVFLFDSNRSHP